MNFENTCNIKFRFHGSYHGFRDLEIDTQDEILLAAIKIFHSRELEPAGLKIALQNLPFSVLERGELCVPLKTGKMAFTHKIALEAHPDYPKYKRTALRIQAKTLRMYLEDKMAPGKRSCHFLHLIKEALSDVTQEEECDGIHIYHSKKTPFEDLESLVDKDLLTTKALDVFTHTYIQQLYEKSLKYLKRLELLGEQSVQILSKPFNPELFYFKQGSEADILTFASQKRGLASLLPGALPSPAYRQLLHYFQWGYCEVDQSAFEALYFFAKKRGIEDLTALLAPHKQSFLFEYARKQVDSIMQTHARIPKGLSLQGLAAFYDSFSKRLYEVLDQYC